MGLEGRIHFLLQDSSTNRDDEERRERKKAKKREKKEREERERLEKEKRVVQSPIQDKIDPNKSECSLYLSITANRPYYNPFYFKEYELVSISSLPFPDIESL